MSTKQPTKTSKKSKVSTPKTTTKISETFSELNLKTTSKKSDNGVKSSQNGFLTNIFDKLLGEKKELSKYAKVVEKVIEFDEKMQSLTDKQLRAKTMEFREMLGDLEGKKLEDKLKEILPEAFAVVREAAFRTLGQKHYPVQMIGAMVLNDGRVAEMKTGEGKTLVSTLTVYLNALPAKNQVHLVTVNDYLARRDASWMGQIYNFLGLTIGVIQNQASFYFKLGEQSDVTADKKREMDIVDTLEDGEKQNSATVLDVENLVPCSRIRAYNTEEGFVDIVYGVNSEFGFDYLRDNMAQSLGDVVQKAGHKVAIVDEVDSILIDEARTPLIISSQDADSSSRYKQFSDLVNRMTIGIDYIVDEKKRTVTLTDLGIEKIERLLGINDLYVNPDNVVLIHHLDQALKAKTLFSREKEYVVRDGEIIIVDENTGRMMFGRRFNQGLHQAIEAKEGVRVQPESKTAASITFQNFFRLYDKLAGMTGTAATESEELFKIYKLFVVTIPTNRPIVRKDYVDKVYKNELGKFKAIARDVKEIHETGQPVLIGTTSIERNEMLSNFLNEFGVKHEVLNAKNHEQEARIISRAGRLGAVTLATNIAGRGVDIKLGGEVPSDSKDMAKWEKLHEQVKSLGGLFVIGTERHESRRIDNQLRGRSGRQGDPGKSQFYISLEDFILRVFGGDRMKYYNILPVADDEAIQNKLLSKLIEEAQKKIEGQNYDIRKYVTEYDDVISRQRSVIYERRRKVLFNENFNWEQEIDNSLYRDVARSVSLVNPRLKKNSKEYETVLEMVSKDLLEISKRDEFELSELREKYTKNSNKSKQIAIEFYENLRENLESKWQIYSEESRAQMIRYIFLRAIDILWTEHLVTIDHLTDSVRLRGYSQKDPLVEFKQDGMKVFEELLAQIDREVAATVFKVSPEMVPMTMREVVKMDEK
jgi:preprotein translocase subunit SecA